MRVSATFFPSLFTLKLIFPHRRRPRRRLLLLEDNSEGVKQYTIFCCNKLIFIFVVPSPNLFFCVVGDHRLHQHPGWPPFLRPHRSRHRRSIPSTWMKFPSTAADENPPAPFLHSNMGSLLFTYLGFTDSEMLLPNFFKSSNFRPSFFTFRFESESHNF